MHRARCELAKISKARELPKRPNKRCAEKGDVGCTRSLEAWCIGEECCNGELSRERCVATLKEKEPELVPTLPIFE